MQVINKLKQILTDFLNRFKKQEEEPPGYYNYNLPSYEEEIEEDTPEVFEEAEEPIEESKRITKFTGTKISSPSKRIPLDRAYPKKKKRK